VETGAGVIAYTVETTEIIKETGTYSFQEEENSVLRLITCYPFFYAGPAPERFIVTARLKAQKN
jgi:sortase A